MVSQNRSCQTWSGKLDDGDFSEGRLLEHVPVPRLRAGMQTRIFIDPGTSIWNVLAHVRFMWPEPVEEGGVQIEISGAPMPTVWIRQMAEDRVIRTPPIPCKPTGDIAKLTAGGWPGLFP